MHTIFEPFLQAVEISPAHHGLVGTSRVKYTIKRFNAFLAVSKSKSKFSKWSESMKHDCPFWSSMIFNICVCPDASRLWWQTSHSDHGRWRSRLHKDKPKDDKATTTSKTKVSPQPTQRLLLDLGACTQSTTQKQKH